MTNHQKIGKEPINWAHTLIGIANAFHVRTNSNNFSKYCSKALRFYNKVKNYLIVLMLLIILTRCINIIVNLIRH